MNRLANKWIRLVVWTGAIFLTSCTYYGWQHFSLLLYKDGAYEWLCTPEEIASSLDQFSCDAQYDAVGDLYTFASSAEFAGALFAGILFDNFGPRLCALLGESMFFAGYAMLTWSSQSAKMYVPGAVIAGFSVNFVAFPMFILAEVWPSRKQLILALVLAVQLAATFITPIMYQMQQSLGYSLSTLMLIYLGVCIPFVALYLLSLPRNRFRMKTEIAEANGEVYDPDSDNAAKTGWGGFFRSMMTVEWLTVLVWYVVQIMVYNAYNVGLRSFGGDAVANFLGWFMPTQAIFALAFGWVNDKMATLWLCVTISAFNMIFMAIGFIPSDGIQFLGAVLYTLSNAYIYTTKYTYCAEVFAPEHFGKLSGSIGFAAGLLQMFNILIDKANPTYELLFGSWLIVSALMLLALLYLLYRQKVLLKTYKPPVDEDVSAEESEESSYVTSSQSV